MAGKRTVELKYDWQSHRVTGVYEGTQVDLPLTPQTQDDASVQLALMVELLGGPHAGPVSPSSTRTACASTSSRARAKSR